MSDDRRSGGSSRTIPSKNSNGNNALPLDNRGYGRAPEAVMRGNSNISLSGSQRSGTISEGGGRSFESYSQLDELDAYGETLNRR